jgi:DNA-binding FrmR family transcriptional regulator
MSHTSKDRAKLIGRIRRIKGQLDGVERKLEDGADCGDILHLIASVRGAINGLTIEVIDDHIRHHVIDPDHAPDSVYARGAGDLLEVLRTYLK